MSGGASVDLYWLPLGAGGHSVRLNDRVYEFLAAGAARRPCCDLYHSALVVRVPEGRVVVEQAPVRDGHGAERGVVAEGPVGSRRAARWRIFRHECGAPPFIRRAEVTPLAGVQDSSSRAARNSRIRRNHAGESRLSPLDVAPPGAMVEETATTEALMDRHGQKRVLIAGGGVAALEAALALQRIAEERVHVELLAPEPRFSYRPMSVAAPFELGDVLQLALDDLAREVGAGLTQGGLVGVDAWRHIAHTSKNREIPYDQLLIACGALSVPAVPGALTFRGPADVELMRGLLRDVAGGTVESVAFVIPWGAVYALPAYELALLTAAQLRREGNTGVEVSLVTPEAEPLQVFGPPASEAIRRLFSDRGIALRTSAYARDVVDGELMLAPEGSVVADRIVALPRLVGAPIDGIPQTVDGFVPVDAHCRVHGVADVYAAGDITSFTVKHGGIATQQADTAAEAIAAAAGADLEPSRFRPVLRGALLTGARPRYLRRELGVERETEPVASLEPLWWPPAKIVGRRLAPFLASKAGVEAPPDRAPAVPGFVGVEHALDSETLARVDSTRVLLSTASDDEPSVASVTSRTAVMVAPEDTLGDAAEALLRKDARAAVVGEYGRIVGILTSSDLLRAAAARSHPAEARVRQWMTAEPLTVPPDASVSAARAVLGRYGIDHLPVVEGESVLGIVDREQLERVLVPASGLGF